MTELTSQNVERIFKSCLFDEGYTQEDISERGIKCEGVFVQTILDDIKVNEHRTEILDMLSQLSDKFVRSKGGGASFLDMCCKKDGSPWTGDHRYVDLLVCLGLAVKELQYCLPRDYWNILPGRMPFIVIF